MSLYINISQVLTLNLAFTTTCLFSITFVCLYKGISLCKAHYSVGLWTCTPCMVTALGVCTLYSWYLWISLSDYMILGYVYNSCFRSGIVGMMGCLLCSVSDINTILYIYQGSSTKAPIHAHTFPSSAFLLAQAGMSNCTPEGMDSCDFVDKCNDETHLKMFYPLWNSLQLSPYRAQSDPDTCH